MKVFQINSFGNLSTGRIAVDITRTLMSSGHEGIVAYGRGTISDDVQSYRIGSNLSVYSDGVMSRLTDRSGFYSNLPTKKLINKIEDYDPDVIHLHNLHGYYINIELLFNFLQKSEKPVVWTLHDCWPFTGHCTHFDLVGCEKWKSGCRDCPQIHEYPKSLFIDNSSDNYIKKRKLFTSVKKMTIVTPSNWLANLVKKSFLNKYPVQVIHNGVDRDVFKPTYGNWVRDHHLENKKIVLGVAGVWGQRKGLNDLITLSRLLPDEFKVVVVGLNDKQLKDLPSNMVGIKRTNDVRELAEIYTSAYIFVNPTYEDNFPSVNLEALSCDTPVITYDTGGCGEVIDEKKGKLVPKGDIYAIAQSIITLNPSIKDLIPFMNKNDKRNMYLNYLPIYKDLQKVF